MQKKQELNIKFWRPIKTLTTTIRELKRVSDQATCCTISTITTHKA